MGIALDETATYQPDPPAPYGFSFSDPEDLTVWWSMGAVAIAAARYFNFALLREVNTYTHRTPDFMLSSALDYRKGSLAAQVHAWQATFDANPLVFTNHPVTPPLGENGVRHSAGRDRDRRVRGETGLRGGNASDMVKHVVGLLPT